MPREINLRKYWSMFTIAVLVVVAILLFVPWDSANRNSFELLGVIHRLDLLPDQIPTRPILMWWTVLPFALIWGMKDIIQQVFQRRDENVTAPIRLWLMLFLFSSSAISFAVSLSPTATSAPRWCFWSSILGICALVFGWLINRLSASQG